VNTLLVIGLTNAVMATVMAIGVAALGRFCHRPALLHSLWLLVLIKLITPPLFMLPIVLPAAVQEPKPGRRPCRRCSPMNDRRRPQPGATTRT
jgi:hypothetical protein